MSTEKGIEKEKLFSDIDNVMSVIRQAHGLGIHGLSLNTHYRGKLIAEEIKKDSILSKDLNIYILLPYMAKYVTMANEKGIISMVNDTLRSGSIFDLTKIGLSSSISLLNKNYLKMIGALIDIELLPYKDLNIKSILLHNALTDLVVGLNFPDIIKFFLDHISTNYKVYPGFCTLSSHMLMNFLSNLDLREQLIMAPFNPIGFQMNPNKTLCEESLKEYQPNLIAMSVLAAGAVSPKKASEYIRKFPEVKSLVIGASTESHLESIKETFASYT